jgi:nitrogen-specific signal transduction histidine kinase/CheY-like chemotaxis protein
MVVVLRDISDTKRLESQIRHSQRMESIGTLAGGIAHDFNNLLMGIQGRTSLITQELPPDHRLIEHSQAIEEHIRSATNLTGQLLGIVRGGKYEVKPMDVNELVQGSAEMFGRTRKELRVHVRTGTSRMTVEADRSQLEQVLLNLYVNAWQAMPDGGELCLETGLVFIDDACCMPRHIEPGPYVKISVTDTGTGMDESVRRRIFDPFFTTKEKGRGTGLGLASAYGIVDNHGGIITVYSEIGLGTTFNIYLPFSDQQALPEATKVSEAVQRGSETVLLIDDEEMITTVGQAMLESLGYGVVIANSGEQAVETLRNRMDKIDLVILDMIMPGLDGGKTFDLIRAIQPSLPVILSSGYSLNGQANSIIQRGCNGFIQKPFNLSQLSAKVRQVLSNKTTV